jgi:hypothetical protein
MEGKLQAKNIRLCPTGSFGNSVEQTEPGQVVASACLPLDRDRDASRREQ